MFEAFGRKPLICIASDEVLNDKNEGTSNIAWYADRTAEQLVLVNGKGADRYVLTTRKDKDVHVRISEDGHLSINTNVFAQLRSEIDG